MWIRETEFLFIEEGLMVELVNGTLSKSIGVNESGETEITV